MRSKSYIRQNFYLSPQQKMHHDLLKQILFLSIYKQKLIILVKFIKISLYMAKQLANKIGRNHAEKLTGAGVDSLMQGQSARDHALNFAQASLSINADNLLIVGEYLSSNPKVAGMFSHALKYGYADVGAGICRDILDKKSGAQIATNAGKNLANGIISGGIGAAAATGAEAVMIGVGVQAFLGGAMWGARLGMMAGPIGAAIGIGVGAVAGVYIGRALDAVDKYISSAIDNYRNSSSSYGNQSRRQSSMSKSDNNAYLGSLGFGGGGGSGGGGNGGDGGGGFYFGNSSAGGAESYLAGILGGANNSDISQFFNKADSHTLASLLNSMNNSSGNSGLGEFAAQLSLQGLVNSFNGYNGGEMAFGLGGLVGDIGGVATQAGEIKGFRNSKHHLENQILICVKNSTGQQPYSNDELRQLMVELAIGVYVEKTVPFFSLHFNQDGSLYPVIHPAYQKTLVGEVISYLDYYMKGFLNGGVFPQSFLQNWDGTMNTSREYLKANLIDLKAYTKKNGIKYHSLREMMAEQGLQSDEINNPGDNTVQSTKFRTSFRIISKLKKVQQESNMFIIDADFDVQYTVDLMPHYKEYLSSYQIQKGKLPQDYAKIETIYRQMAQQIKQIMPTLPFCQKYFEMLKVITFLTSYYKTLRQMMKVPILDQINLPKNKVPKAFPPIPVRYYSFHRLSITIGEVLKQIQLQSIKNNKPNLLDQELFKVFEQGKNNFDKILKDIITTSLEILLKKALGTNFQNELDLSYTNGLAQLFNSVMVRSALTKEANFMKQIEEINNQFKKDPRFQKIDIGVMNSKPTLSLKIQYFIEMIRRNQPVRLEMNKAELIKHYETQLTKYNAETKKVQTEFEAKKIKQLKDFEINLKNEANKAEINRKAQMNSFVNDIRSQGSTLIASQLAKIPSYLHTTNATQIQQFKNEVETKIQAEIKNKEEESKKNLQRALKQAEENGKKAIREDQLNRQNRLTAQITRLKTQLQADRRKKLADLPNLCKKQTEEIIKNIRTMQSQLKTMTKSFLNNTELAKMNLATKTYLNSQLTIADKGYYKEMGDNFRIIGGCGVKLPQIVPGTVPFGKETLSKISNILMKNQKDTIYMQKIGNETLLTFKTVCSDNRFSYDFSQMLNFYKARANQLKELEYQLILYLLKKLPIQGLLANKNLNINSVNKQGLTLGHISVVSAMQKQNLGLLYAKDKNIFNTADDYGNLPIHTAAIYAPTSNIQYLLSINKNCLQSKNHKGLTPLLCAVIASNLDSVDLLLKMGANVNYKLPNCFNALFFALERGDEQVCLRLLAVPGINVNATMPSGDTALHLAIRLNLVQVARKIIIYFQNLVQAKTKSKGFNPLHEAAYNKRTIIVQDLLRTGKIPINAKTDAGDTALHLAAQIGCINTTRLLLAYKANPDEMNKRMETPLSKAIINNNQQLSLILTKVTQVNKLNTAGKSYSLLAYENFLFEVADHLFLRGDNINTKDIFDNSCTGEMVKNGQLTRFEAYKSKISNHKTVVIEEVSRQHNILTNSYILENKLEESTFNGKKMIHVAVINDEVGYVKKWLEKNGRTPNILQSSALKDSDGVTKNILLLAAQNGSHRCLRAMVGIFLPQQILSTALIFQSGLASGNSQVIQILVSLLEDINQPLDSDHNNLAHKLVLLGLVKEVKIFHRRGLSLIAKNKKGETTISIAIHNNDEEMLEELLDLVPIKQYPPESFKQILLSDKKQCLGVIHKKNKFKQIKCDPTLLLLSAVENENIDELKNLLKQGANPNQIVNKATLLQVGILKNNVAIVDLLLEFKADPLAKFNNIDAIQLAAQKNRINIIELFHNKGKIPIPNNYKSPNFFTTQALKKNFKPFYDTSTILIECVKNLNLKIFEQKIKDFPLDELLTNKQKARQPILFNCYQMEFQAGIKLIADKVNPLTRNQSGIGLSGLILRSNSAKQLIDYTKKYFSGIAHQILAQKFMGVNIVALASLKGKQEVLDAFIEYSAKLLKPLDQKGNYLIHLLVQSNHAASVQKLLKNDVWRQKVDVENFNRKTPLMLACLNGNENIAKMLLKCGANPNKTDIKQFNSLHYSLISENQNNAFFLILPLIKDVNISNRVGLTPLILAAAKGKTKQLKRLLLGHALVNQANNQGMQPIYFAARFGSFECLQALVQAGADVNAQTIHPTSKQKSILETPSHAAAQSGNYKCLNYLFNRGADMTIKDSQERTPIEAAIQSKNKPLEKMIKQFPYYHNIQNQWSLLKAAVKGQNQHILKQFILCGFNVNITDKNGMNMLHVAAIVDSPRCGAILMRERTSAEAVDSKGNTPLHYAAQNGSQALVEIFHLHVINAQNSTEETALHLACRKNHISVVITLLKVNVEFSIKNKLGMTPAQVALQYGNYEICEVLTSCGDVSLQEDKINLLPEHIKTQYLPHQLRLKSIQKVINGKQPSNLLIALKLMNIDAVKLALMMKPSEFYRQDKNKKSPIQIANQLKFTQATTLFTEFALTFKDTKFDLNLPVKKNVEVQKKIKPAQKSKPFNYQQVCAFLRDDIKIQPTKIPGFVDYISRKSTQLCIMFCIGVQKSKTHEQFIKKWLALLQKLENHPSVRKFEETFLTYYSWDFFFNPLFFELCEKVLLNPKFSKVQPWFFKHFQPLVFKRNQTFIDKGIKAISNFCLLLEKLNLLDMLDNAPKRCISFWLNQKNYIEYCIKCLEYSGDKVTQAGFLGQLPEINQIQEQIRLKNLIVCEHFVMERPLVLLPQISNSLDLSILKKDIENFAINKFPHRLNGLLNFFQALQEVTSEELTNQQKLLLTKKYLEGIDFKQNIDNSFIYSFLELAKSLRNHLGLRIFELLFNKKIICLKDSILKAYCKICELMLEIDQVTALETLLLKNLASNKLNLDKVADDLNEMYLLMLKNKYPEKNIQVLQKEFLTKGQFIKSPLPDSQFKEIAEIYKQIDFAGKQLYSVSSQELKQMARTKGHDCKNPKNVKAKIIVLAVLREFIRRQMKILPYNTQILSVLGLINKKQELKGRIAQVRTGEGKSTIVAILSAYMALQGNFVDIITSSQYLAKRDKEKYEDFYKSLGISCSHICSNQPTKQMFNGQVLFGTNYDFEFSILRDELYHSQLRYTQRNGNLIKRGCELVIVDEVDSLFLDMALNSARLAIPSPFHTSWIYELIYYYVEGQLKLKKPLEIKEVRSILVKYRDGLFQETIKTYSDSKIQNWIEQAKKATQMVQNKNYVVKYTKEKNQMEIIIVDFENTGRLNVGSRWSYGLHEFVEVKHKIKPKDESLTAASMSHPAFFNQYGLIYGLTGTIGTEQQRKQVQSIYRVDSFDVPPHYPSLRRRLPIQICEEPKYFDSIFAKIQEQKKTRRPVLVLMKSIKQTQRFGEFLKTKNTKHFLLNQTQKEDEDYIISKAGLLDSVVVATNTAGRGTDIILSPESKKAGGLHVIFAFYPTNSRVEDQGLGRAGRQGQSGTCQVYFHEKDQEYLKYKQFICLNDNLEVTLTNLRQQKIRSLSQLRQKQSMIETIKYKILKNFCQELNKLREGIQKQEISPYLNSCINFKYQQSLLKRELNENPTLEAIIKKGCSLLKLQEKGSPVEWNPFIQSLMVEVPNLVMEQWGVFYSEIIQMPLMEEKLYESIVFESYQQFNKRAVMDYKKNLSGKIKSILKAVLSCSHETISLKNS